MKKLYCLLLIVFSVTTLLSQSNTGLVEAVKNSASRYQFFDKKTGLKVNDLSWEETEPFVNGFARVFSDSKWGFVDLSGNLIVSTRYEAARNFYNNLAAVRLNSKWGFINEKGKAVIPFEYDILFDLKETVTAGHKNNKWFLIDRQGTAVKQLNADIIWGFKNGVSKITSNGRSGTMNTKGEIISWDAVLPANQKSRFTGLRTNNTQNGTCPANIDFEDGNFTNWSCDTGQVAAVGTTNVITVFPNRQPQYSAQQQAYYHCGKHPGGHRSLRILSDQSARWKRLCSQTGK